MRWFRRRRDNRLSDAEGALKEALAAHEDIQQKEKEMSPLLDRMTSTASGNGIFDQVLLTLRRR